MVENFNIKYEVFFFLGSILICKGFLTFLIVRIITFSNYIYWISLKLFFFLLNNIVLEV